MPDQRTVAQWADEWLRIRIFPSEPESARAARLRGVALGTLLIAVVGLAVLMALEPASINRRLVSLAAVVVIIGSILQLNRRGHTTSASWILLLGLIGMVTQRAWITGGIYAPVMPLYVLFVMIGGMLLSRIGGVVAVLACTAGGAVLIYGQAAGLITPVRDFAPPGGMLVFLVMILAIALLLQFMIGAAFRTLLDQAEAEIVQRKATQTRLELAISAARIAVWEHDRERDCLHCDSRMAEFYDTELNPDGTIAVDTILSRVHPDDHAKVAARRQPAWPELGVVPHELRLVRPDGSLRYLQGISAAIPGPTAASSRVVGVTMDVTVAKLAELERTRLVHDLGERVKELRLLHATAMAGQGGWNSSRDLLAHIVSQMPAAWQYPECAEARIVLGDVEVTTPGWRRTAWVQSVPLATEEAGGLLEVAYLEPRPAAAYGPFLQEESELLVSLSEMLAAVFNSRKTRRDLELLVQTRTTELASSLEQQRALEGLRDDLVHMMIHDMRGLLTVVMAGLEFAQPELSGQPAKDVTDALNAVGAVVRMANTVLDVSRLEEGKMPVKLEPVDVALLAARAVETLRMMDASRTLRCVTEGPITTTCDADLVRRVIENLISNAIKHTPRQGNVTVEVRAAGSRTRVSVRDEGPGVPAELRSTLFEKFAAAQQRSRQHSAGLGLAFCKLAVAAHDGTVGVEPAQPHGSIFWFELPT